MPELILPARGVDRSTPRTRIIEIDLQEHRFPFVAGQAVFAGLARGRVRRPYSIACSPGQAARARALELLVQIDDHNPPDPHLELVQPGTLLRIEGPFGSFALPAEAVPEALLFIAGGTGIAPLRSMMWDVLEKRPEVRIGLLYSARSPEEFAYDAELRRLAAASKIKITRTATRQAGTEWHEARGRLSRDLIAPMLNGADVQCVICGPAALVADATELLRSFGIPTSRILTEPYGA